MQLPQLDFSYYPSQFFWLVICYSVLYLFLKFIILPKFARILKNRELFLNKAKTIANDNISSAQELLKAKQEELLQVKKTVLIQIEQARASAQKSFIRNKLLIDQKNALMLKEANLELQDLKNNLKQNANLEIAKSSSLILKRVFNITIDYENILNSIQDDKYDS